MNYILDTSAILSRRFNLSSADFIIPASVMEEITKGRLKSTLDTLQETARILTPARASREVVERSAKQSGDLSELSSTDIDVLALAIETGASIISDDYAIQNVASKLNLQYTGASITEIKTEVQWKYRCTGCRRAFKEPVGNCPVCGHEVVRTRRGARSKEK